MKMHVLISVLCGLTLLLSACDQQNSTPATKEVTSKKKKAKSHLVEVITVQAVESRLTSRWYGSLRYNDIVHIFNQEKGRIDQFKWRVGDTVKQGEALVYLDDHLLQAERTKLQARIQQAKADVQRLQTLGQKKLISSEEVEHARTTLNLLQADDKLLAIRLGYFQINAPFAAIVTERLVNLGDAVSQHTHLLTLSDPTSLIANVYISESFLSELRVGMNATLELGNPAKTYDGKVLRIHPSLHPSTRQATVEVAFKKRPRRAFAGQSATVILQSPSKKRLLIPITALKRDEQGEYVFLWQEDNKAKRQPVRSGQYINGKLEITQGLKVADTLIVRGFLGLNDGKKVKKVEDNPKSKSKPKEQQP